MDGSAIGSLVGAGFGCAWALAGAAPLKPPLRIAAILAGLAVTSGLVAMAIHHTPTSAGSFGGAIYGAAVLFELVAITTAATLLRRRGRSALLPSAVATIVGLHFVGLWLATGNAVFAWLALALVCVGFGSACVPREWRLTTAGFGSALCLWASVWATMVR
jgi:hypothetical protein